MSNLITVTVNGEPKQFASDSSLLELLEAFELDPRAVVVELNRQIVRRPTLGETALREGDQVELVHFVGGG